MHCEKCIHQPVCAVYRSLANTIWEATHLVLNAEFLSEGERERREEELRRLMGEVASRIAKLCPYYQQ